MNPKSSKLDASSSANKAPWVVVQPTPQAQDVTSPNPFASLQNLDEENIFIAHPLSVAPLPVYTMSSSPSTHQNP